MGFGNYLLNTLWEIAIPIFKSISMTKLPIINIKFEYGIFMWELGIPIKIVAIK